jgi:hypothetical protein
MRDGSALIAGSCFTPWERATISSREGFDRPSSREESSGPPTFPLSGAPRGRRQCDHIIPLSLGVRKTPDNIRVCFSPEGAPRTVPV